MKAAGRTGPLRHLGAELTRLETLDQLRMRPGVQQLDRGVMPGGAPLVLCSNDYLGYGARGTLRPYVAACAEGVAPGAGASRLVSGDHPAHRALERAIARWLGTEEALVFTSGYAANVGAIAALSGRGDLIISDALNHASIIDGCRLSRAHTIVTPHLDADAVRHALRTTPSHRRWVVTESYFSMDGDIAPLRDLREICDETDAALVVDEAHALGVFGPEGRGVAAELGVVPDVLIGTLGKALATQGAFVAGSAELCAWLWNRARTLVFSTGLSPLVAQVAARAVELARADEGSRGQLGAAERALRGACDELGLPVARTSRGPIIPILIGADGAARRISERLAAAGVFVQAIRAPTVPEGGARLRLTGSAAVSVEDVDRFREAAASAFVGIL